MNDAVSEVRRVAVVTGAGSGVGRDTALLLADAGYAVVLAARTEAKLHAAADYIRSEGDPGAELLICPTDVTDSAACQRLITQAHDTFGRIDALAHCAGSAPLQPIDKMTDEIIRDALAVNLQAAMYLTRALWPIFRQQKAGAIVSVSSMASIDPFNGFNVYAAAKAGLNLFTRATADEGKRFNVVAATVAPGAIETAMLRQNFPEKMIPQSKTLDPLTVAGVIRDILTGQRPVKPGETVLLPSP